MNEFANSGEALAAEIESTDSASPTLWWLGHSGFAIKSSNMLFLVDACLSEVRAASASCSRPSRRACSLHRPDPCTHAHPLHMDAGTLVPLLHATTHTKVVLPKSAAAHAARSAFPTSA